MIGTGPAGHLWASQLRKRLAEGHELGVLVDLGLPSERHRLHAHIRAYDRHLPDQGIRQLMGQRSLREGGIIPVVAERGDERPDPPGQVRSTCRAYDGQRVTDHVSDRMPGMHVLREGDDLVASGLGGLPEQTSRRQRHDPAAARLRLMVHVHRLGRVAGVAGHYRESPRADPAGQFRVLHQTQVLG